MNSGSGKVSAEGSAVTSEAKGGHQRSLGAAGVPAALTLPLLLGSL